jgi:hypothetical protein
MLIKLRPGYTCNFIPTLSGSDQQPDHRIEWWADVQSREKNGTELVIGQDSVPSGNRWRATHLLKR